MPKLKTRPFLPRPDDPDILKRIRDAITKGHPLRTAATLAGLHEDTAYGWKSRGKTDLEGWDGESELSSHAYFVLMLKEAEAACLDRCLDPVEDQIAQGNWVTGMTLAERRFPQDFGRNQRIEIEANATVRYVHELDTDAAKAIAQNILSALSESDTGGISEPPTPLLSEAAETD